MPRFSIRQLLLGIVALPLTLALAACGDEVDEMAGLSGEKIEAIAPPEGKSWTEIARHLPTVLAVEVLERHG